MERNGNFRKTALAAAVTAACMTVPGALHAQESGAAVMEEIEVTATRRTTSVQDIPYNISAMSGEYLEMQDVVNQWDVLRAMYGVTVIDRGYRNAGTVNSIVIRGLNVDNGANGDIMLNAVPTVATYYDNMPVFGNFLVKDVERVEVLRGPQGTLYGSGSLGGTVRYIASKPNPEGFEADVELDYSQTSGSDGNNMAVDAVLNLPLGDRAAVRAVYSHIDNDGVIDYINAYQLNEFREPLINVGGSCVDPRQATDAQILSNVACFENVEDADEVQIDYARVAIGADLTDDFSLLFSYHWQEDDIAARRSTTLGDNNQPSGSDLYFAYGDDDSGQVLIEPSSRDVEAMSLDLEWDLGFATFTSTSSVYDHEGTGESDNGGLWASGGEVDGTSRDWNAAFYGGGWPRPAQRAERGYDDEAFMQEFRLVSNDREGSTDWILGAFYMDQDTSVYQLSWNPGMNLFHNACVDTGGAACDGFWPAIVYSGSQLSEIDFEYVRDTAYEEMAVYGELTWHLSDTARVTGGFRWFDNETVNDTILGFPLGEGATSPSAPRARDSDDDVLIKLNASWDLSDTDMLYATYSEGYRHGGAQAVPSDEAGDNFGEPNAEAIRTFASDSVQNYEIGIKGRRENLLYTAAAFHVDWDDPQLNTTSIWWGFYLAANGDKASTEGLELELEGNLSDSLHYRIGYTYVDAQLDKDFFSPQTGDLVAPKGSTLPASPSNVFSFNLDNTWNLASGMDLVAAFNAYYQGKSEGFIDQEDSFNETYDSFWLLGARLSLVGEKWSATLYGKNLGDEAAPTGGFSIGYWSYDTGVFENWYGNGNRQFIAQPRTIGLKLSYRF